MNTHQQRVVEVMGGAQVRVVTVDGTDWWCAADLADAFGAPQHGGQFTRGVPESMKGVQKVDTLGGQQEMVCVTWTGVTYIAALTRTPVADSAFLALLAGHERTAALARSAATGMVQTTPTPAPAFDAQQLAAVVARAVTEAVAPAIMRGLAQGRRDGIWERKRRAEGQAELPGMLSPPRVEVPSASGRVLAVLTDVPTGVERVSSAAKCSDKTARAHLLRLKDAGHAVHHDRLGWTITEAGKAARQVLQ